MIEKKKKKMEEDVNLINSKPAREQKVINY